jgi:hypothetical protein
MVRWKVESYIDLTPEFESCDVHALDGVSSRESDGICTTNIELGLPEHRLNSSQD